MFRSQPAAPHAVCTVRRHPEGGYTPVLHMSNQTPPAASVYELSLPSLDDCARYARNNYGTLVVQIADECRSAHAA